MGRSIINFLARLSALGRCIGRILRDIDRAQRLSLELRTGLQFLPAHQSAIVRQDVRELEALFALDSPEPSRAAGARIGQIL